MELKGHIAAGRDAQAFWLSDEKRLSGKASSCIFAARTKTDTGGLVENTKVSERTVAKELGKMTPYVRKKGCSKSRSE